MQASLIVNEKDQTHFEQATEDTILRAALRAGVGLAYECNSGGCGACKFELLQGQVETLWPEAPGLSERDRKRGRHLACQCRAQGEIRIKATSAKEYLPPIVPQRHSATLTRITDITHDIREFCFTTEAAAEFLPGQYAMLDLPEVGTPRAYSMSNIANPAQEWQFQIRRVVGGKATEVLFDQLKVGDRIGLDGPYGVAYLRPEAPRDIVCVAGGSGLAPMLSIARGAAAIGLLQERRLHFFYGARTARDVCGEVELQALTMFGERMSYQAVVSDTSTQAWQGACGFVHTHIPQVLEQALNAYEFYFAGPPLMTQALQEMLMVDYRVPFEQIHFDRFF